MNRVLSFRHPLRALVVSNPNIPIPFSPLFQSDPFKQRLVNSEIHKDKPGVSSLFTFTKDLREFCNINEDLSTKKCVPYNTKDLRPMTYDEAHTLIQQVAQWNLVNEVDILKLRRLWKVKTFTKGLEFFRRIAKGTKVAQWNLVNDADMLKLRRSWKVKNFDKGFEIYKRLAEAEGHHLNLLLIRLNVFGWTNVTIEIWTHAVGGLTENDFIRAAKIDGLNLDDLLRRC